jgi:hypothetical protein
MSVSVDVEVEGGALGEVVLVFVGGLELVAEAMVARWIGHSGESERDWRQKCDTVFGERGGAKLIYKAKWLAAMNMEVLTVRRPPPYAVARRAT